MTHGWSTMAAVSALGTLLGCAQLGSPSPQSSSTALARDAMPVKVAAIAAAARVAATSTAESEYLMGRAAHGAGQLAQARGYYAQVLAKDPRHVGALNAMAVIHAQEGRLEDALQLFAEAMAVAPQAAHLHNNAGYALLRAGRLSEAETALLRARDLDPGNAQAAQNMALLRAEQARAERVPRPAPQAKTDHQEPATGPKLVAVAPQVYELQAASRTKDDTPTPAFAPTAVLPVAAVPPVAKTLRGVRVEVSNGVGITRLARRTADRLAPTGLVAARLTNAKPYRQATTEIQFGTGQEQLAQALMSHLPVAARVVAVSHLQPGIQMRLVLGHDLAGKTIAAWLDGTSEPLHATSFKEEGWLWS